MNFKKIIVSTCCASAIVVSSGIAAMAANNAGFSGRIVASNPITSAPNGYAITTSNYAVDSIAA